MESLEQLKAEREREATAFQEVAKGLELKREKKRIRQDIKKIRAAKLRGRFGFAKLEPNVQKLTKGTGKSLKTIGKIGLGLLDGLKALDESSKDYVGTSDRRKKKDGKKNEAYL